MFILVVLAISSLIANSSVLEVVQLVRALENNICCSSLQKCAEETACTFLGGVKLVLVITMRVEEEEKALRYRWSRDFR